MSINALTFFIILINVLLLFGEIPNTIIIYTVFTIISSFLFKKSNFKVLIKIFFLIGSLFLLKHSFPKIFQAESAISFVFILAGLKSWELNNENDHFNMFLILALSEAGIYLLNPGFLVFALGILKTIFYFYYILTIRQHKLAQINLKRLLVLITPSVLFAIILFYVFPRFTQGFLNTSNNNLLLSGNRADLNFKELGPLNLSSNKVFKVYGLNNHIKNLHANYWRQMVLWDYHSSKWLSGNLSFVIKENNLLASVSKKSLDINLNYQIETANMPIDYLPFADLTKPRFQGFNTKHSYFEFLDNTYKLKSPKQNGINYTIYSSSLDLEPLSFLMNKKSIKLKSQKKDLVFNKYFHVDDLKLSDHEKLKHLNRIFSGRGFQYSLTPPRYDSLESFLLSGNSGYCSHFASSYAYLARLIELPTRLVTGYLGGEINPYDDSIIVRELDAHVWVEVFLKGKGWVRVDPTEMVFPERLRVSNATITAALNPAFFYNHFGYLKSFSLWGDALNSKLDTLLFNLDKDQQTNLFSFLFKNKFSAKWFFLIVFLAGTLMFYFLPTLIYFNHLSSAQVRYFKFLKKLKKIGLLKRPHETALQFSLRATLMFPDLKSYIDLETKEYLKRTYEIPQKLGKKT